MSNFTQEKNVSIFSNPENTIDNSYVNQNGEILEDIEGFKRTDYLDISLANLLRIQNNISGYTQRAFFNRDKIFLGIINNLGQYNEEIPATSFPEGSVYVILNLQTNELPDASSAISITVDIDVLANIKRLDKEVTDLESQFVKKSGNRVLYSALDEIKGSFVSGNNGIIQSNASAGRTDYIDVAGASTLVFSNFKPGLNIKWFYDTQMQPLAPIQINNGTIETIPFGARYMMFTTRTSAIVPDRSEIITADVNEVVGEIALLYPKREKVYLKDYEEIYYPPGTLDQDITAEGMVRTNRPGSAWTGHLRLIQNRDIKIAGIPTGFNAKVFFDDAKNVLSILSINNGIIRKENIPLNAVFIGMNTKNPTLGDGVNSAKVSCFIDDLLAVSSSQEKTIIGIPSIIPVVQGIQMNIYLDNIRSNPLNDTTELFIHEGAPIAVTASAPFIYKTRRTERALQYLPSTVGETVQLYARLRDRNYQVLTERHFQARSVSPNNGTNQRNIVLLAGDSQIDPVYDNAKTSFAPFLKKLFDDSDSGQVIFIGNRPMTATIYGETSGSNTTITCPTEGRGGRQITWFFESTSPFWNPNKPGGAGIDFPFYIESLRNQSGNPFNLLPNDQINYFIFPMGVNDFNAGISTEAIIQRMKIMIALVHDAYPTCVFIIGLVTQGSEFWSMDVRRKWNIEYYVALINEFEKPEYARKVFLAAAGLWTDNIFGSRQIRPFREPYKRIVDAKNILINKLIQTTQMSIEEATEKVNVDYGLLVEERVLEKWNDEYPQTNDIVHSSWISAMQQADCYYSAIKFLMA